MMSAVFCPQPQGPQKPSSELKSGTQKSRIFKDRTADDYDKPKVYQHSTNGVDHGMFFKSASVYLTIPI